MVYSATLSRASGKHISRGRKQADAGGVFGRYLQMQTAHAQIISVMSPRLSLAAGFLRVDRAESELHRHLNGAMA
jgi:hypothetical protein